MIDGEPQDFNGIKSTTIPLNLDFYVATIIRHAITLILSDIGLFRHPIFKALS